VSDAAGHPVGREFRCGQVRGRLTAMSVQAATPSMGMTDLPTDRSGPGVVKDGVEDHWIGLLASIRTSEGGVSKGRSTEPPTSNIDGS
jgi:hypothetical protein